MNASKSYAAVLALLATVLAAGCGARATKEDCEKMVDHMIDVQVEGKSKLVADMTKKLMQDEKGKLVGECAGKVKKADVDCVIAAKKQSDIDKCR